MPSQAAMHGQSRPGLFMSIPSLISLAFFSIFLPQDIARGPLEAEYRIKARDAVGNEGVIPLEVELHISNPPRHRTVLQIPVWAPGSYRLRDFPEHISVIGAEGDDGEPLTVIRLNRHSWQVQNGNSRTLVFRYVVDLRPNDRFMMVDPRRRCLTYEGPKVYIYVRGHKDIPCRVNFDLPDGWSVGSGLVAQPDGSYFAPDYDFLADCPVKLGKFQRFGFESHGKPIDIVVDAVEDLDFDQDAWLANIKAIVDSQGDIFGGFPFDRYSFLFTVSPGGGGGGLEHLTSTAIGLRAARLIDSPKTGMGVIAHEFFHLWNVKRLRPEALGPFDYSRPNRTTALWVAEGITSYYTDVTLARIGDKTEEEFWLAMQRQIRSLENNPAREHLSSAQASYRVWDPKPRDRTLSYYNSGEVLGLLLDIEIRAHSDNRKSLDDFMRDLFDRCQARGRGFADYELASVASNLCGHDMSEWFDRYVYGTMVPPYAQILARAGIVYEQERSRRKRIRGLRRSGDQGELYYRDPDGLGRQRTIREGLVKRVAGKKVQSLDEVGEVIERMNTTSEVEITLQHPLRGEFTLSLRITTVPRVQVRLSIDPDASREAQAIRAGIITAIPGR